MTNPQNDHYLRRELYDEFRKNSGLLDFLEAGVLDGIWYWDLEHPEHEWMSPRFWALLGIDPAKKEHSPSSWQELIHPDDLQMALLNFERHREDPTHPYDQVVRYRHADGSTVWVRCRGIAIRDESGKAIRLLGAHTDLTKVRQAQQAKIELEANLIAEQERRKFDSQLQRVQKLESLGVLAGGIAHDFNNLLVGVLGYADLALSDLTQASPVRPFLEEIKKAGQVAAHICQQMLAYAGKGKFVVRDLQINEVVSEFQQMLEVSVSKKVLLRLDLAENLPFIRADATQLRQIIINLVINASEAIGDRSGVVRVSTGAMELTKEYLSDAFYPAADAEPGPFVYCEVSDTGCGIEPENLEKIFEPFHTTKFTGRGLGLAAALGIMRGHNGALKVYSEPNVGTTFKILFPAGEVASTSAEPKVPEPELAGATATILLVDDNPTVLTVGSMMLRQAGYSVLSATDGVHALEVFRERKDEIACVVLDLTMPRLDGEETFRALREICPDVTVVLSSGYNAQDITNRFAGKGLAGFIKKPYTMAGLVSVIRKATNAGT